MTGLPDVVIRDLRPADVGPAVRVLVDSFTDFPALSVLVGSDHAAPERLHRVFEMEFEEGSRVRAIVAETHGRVVGVLTYADRPDCSHMSAGQTIRFVRIAGTRLFRTLRFFARVEGVHPRSPHRHLPSIGVIPELQGSGIGSRLMEAFDRGCDAAGLPGYLETIRWTDASKPSHERFYRRAGFAVRDELKVGDEWDLLTMVRPTRPPEDWADQPRVE